MRVVCCSQRFKQLFHLNKGFERGCGLSVLLLRFPCSWTGVEIEQWMFEKAEWMHKKGRWMRHIAIVHTHCGSSDRYHGMGTSETNRIHDRFFHFTCTPCSVLIASIPDCPEPNSLLRLGVVVIMVVAHDVFSFCWSIIMECIAKSRFSGKVFLKVWALQKMWFADLTEIIAKRIFFLKNSSSRLVFVA